MESNFNSDPKAVLSLVLKVLNRLLHYGFPATAPVGFYLSLLSSIQELEEVQSYLKNMEL